MKFLFFYFVFVYFLVGFSSLFFERPSKPARAAFLLFLGPWWEIYVNILAALTEPPPEKTPGETKKTGDRQ